MFKRFPIAYWSCQFLGWGLTWGICALNQFYGYVAGYKITITCVAGFLATHVLRTVMHRYGQRPLFLKKEAVRLILAAFFTAVLAAILKGVGFYFFAGYHGLLTPARLFLTFPVDYLLLVGPWTLLYWGHRVTLRNRRQAGELYRLHSQFDQMQTRARELGISVDELLEETRRIARLIDENPAQARIAITAFGQLLREGYLA
jgi:hypothetical protein